MLHNRIERGQAAMKCQALRAIFVARDEAKGAYALLGLARPALDLGEWTSSLPSRIIREQEAGFIGLRDGGGRIHSLFAFQVTQPSGQEPTLQLCEFASLRLPGTLVIRELLRFANEFASKLGVSSIAIEVDSSSLQTRDRQALEQRGFAIERVMMRGKAHPAALQVIGGNKGASVVRPSDVTNQ